MNQAAGQQAQFAPIKRLEYARRLRAMEQRSERWMWLCFLAYLGAFFLTHVLWQIMSFVCAWFAVPMESLPFLVRLIPIGIAALPFAAVFAAVGGQERRARRKAGLICPHCNRLFPDKVAATVLFTDCCGYCNARLLAD